MPFPEEIQRIDARRRPTYHPESDAIITVKQKAGESLARYGHHHQEAVRDTTELPKAVGELATGYTLYDEIIDIAFGDRASHELGPYIN